jgi:drug/metabolite transporter (DMT)-like permease
VNLLALVLILAAAVCHATWNLLYKQASGGPEFVWMHTSVSAVLFGPLALAVVLLQRQQLAPRTALAILVSTLIHAVYFSLLRKGYGVGDLSLIYPLARGTGPALATGAAISFLGERPTGIALVGSLLVVASILLFIGPFTGRDPWYAILLGLLTGVSIGCYTVWDKFAVSRVRVEPLLMEWGITLGLSFLLAPLAASRWNEVRQHWRAQRMRILAVGLLCPLSYLLILTAMVFSPVSYIAPAREISILIGVMMGARVLAEGHPRRRYLASIMMICGVVALAIG